MAYREYDDKIFWDYIDVTVMGVIRALLSQAECQYERYRPTKLEMYKIEEALNMLDDFCG